LAVFFYDLFADWMCLVALLFADIVNDCCVVLTDFELEGFACSKIQANVCSNNCK